MVAVGHGFDGANHYVTSQNGYASLTEDISRGNLHFDRASQMIDLKTGEIVRVRGSSEYGKTDQGLMELRIILDRQTRPAYLEIVNASLECNDWVATQYCQFNVEPVSKPSVQKYRIVAETPSVVGTGLVQTSGVVIFSARDSPEKLLEINKQQSGYLLCTSIGTYGFFKAFPAEYYSNAGAIVILQENKHPLFSHLNGLPRELGIPVLCINTNISDFMQNIRKSVGFYANSGVDSKEAVEKFDRAYVENAKLTVYVKEFSKEGLIVRTQQH